MAPKFRSRLDGTKYPIHDGGGGKGTTAVLAGVTALGIWAASGGGGSAVLGGSTGSTAMSTAESAVVRDVKTNLNKARRDIKRGHPQRAWRRLGLRSGARKTREAVECAVSSYGQVRDYLVHTPCGGMRRVQFPVSYDGGTISVLVSEVRMRSRSNASQFRRVIDRHGSGDILPMLPGVRFTGYHYGSDRERKAVFVAEAEATSGDIPGPLLDAVADAAARLARAAM